MKLLYPASACEARYLYSSTGFLRNLKKMTISRYFPTQQVHSYVIFSRLLRPYTGAFPSPFICD